MIAKQKYIYWQDEDMWIGYLEEFPGYWTQGETEVELQENLIDLYEMAASLPAVVKRDERPIR